MRPWRDRSETESMAIPDMLVYCCGLPSTLMDGLPQRVCFSCISRLEEAYSICRTFKETETILDRFYLNGSVLDRLVQYEKFRFAAADEPPVDEPNRPTEDDIANEPPQEEEADPPLVNVLQLWAEEPDNNEVVNPKLEILNDENSSIANSTPQSYFKGEEYDLGCSTDEYRKEVQTQRKSNTRNKKPLLKWTGHESIGERIKRPGGRGGTRKKFMPEPGADGFFHCIYCPRKMPHRRNFMEHLTGHRALMEQRYKCPMCGKIFGKRDHLMRHIERHQRDK